MRIAVISRVFSRSGGGAESYSVAVVQELAQRHDIHVFAQESNHPVPNVTYHPVFLLSRKPRWINQLLFAVTTWWFTRRGFDVIHSHENTWHGQIQTIHVRPLRYNLFHSRTGMRLLMQWFRVALSPRLMTYVWLERVRFNPKPDRHVIATSETLKRECEQTYPASKALLSVITPGTYTPRERLTPGTVRRQLGFQVDAQLLLFVANDYARKGLDALLLAMAQLPQSVQLIVAGNPKNIQRYRQKAEQLGVRSRVNFLGSLDDLSPVYQAVDCLVHPTLEDSFAMVVLEAMAHGLPVVVSGPAYCGISRQLQDELHALLLQDPRDASELASVINKVLKQPALADQLRRQALAFAQQHSWDSAALQYELLYRQVVSENLHDR
jgi:glycosyltransferase involved in cell wall biosynthesis